MEPIKIQVDINIGERTEAFLTKLLSGIYAPCENQVQVLDNGHSVEAKGKTATEVKPTQKAAEVKPTQKAPVVPAKTAAVAAPVAGAPAAQAASSATNELSITDVRKLLATKVNAHREAIKEKLNEYGVANVTTLPTDKYPEFYKFLTEL